MAEVAEVDGLEEVGGAAVAAVLGVGGVRHAGQRERVVVNSEVQDARRPSTLAAEVGDHRVVGVEHQSRVAARAHRASVCAQRSAIVSSSP